MRAVVPAVLGLVLAACQPLTRDMTGMAGNDPGELAVVEKVEPARVDTASAGDRLVPILFMAGPAGLLVAATQEGDFNTVNGRLYHVRTKDGRQFALQGLAPINPSDCILLRRDAAGRYMTPVRQPGGACAF